MMPAIVANRYRDVVAANQLARALSPEFTPGQNLLRWRLFEPAAREFYVDWDEATEILVNGLRELSGHCPLDPRMRALIAELSDTSPRFREPGGVERRWGIAWEPTTFVTRRSAIFISADTSSSHRIRRRPHPHVSRRTWQ
jgi:hypothetical protein